MDDQNQFWATMSAMINGPRIQSSPLGGLIAYEEELRDTSYYLSREDLQRISAPIRGEHF